MSDKNTYDAIIIGAGHNGLTTALYLAQAGWRVLVLERNERIGGAVMSGEITRPGFIHDLYSTNQNLFLSSPVYKEFKQDLERHGLHYTISEYPYSSLFPDGKSIRIYRDQKRTLELLHEHNPGDAEGWMVLYDRYKTFQKAFLPIYHMPLPSLEAILQLWKAFNQIGWRQMLRLSRVLANSTWEVGEAYFKSPELRALIATWGMHMDFGPDVSGGAMFPFLETFADMEQGMAIVEGGASRMVEALAGLVREYGGDIRTEAPVVEVLHNTINATGVRTASGEEFQATRAVIANLAPTTLFEHLIKEVPFPGEFLQDVRDYRYGPGTMMIHLALDAPVPWRADQAEELQKFAYVHIAPYVDDLAKTYDQSLSGMLPDEPLLIVGQTTAVDPSRAPEGQHILWIQVRTLPSVIQGDSKGKIPITGWDEAKIPFAERVLDKLERYAPGVRESILEMVVYSPQDLERHNPNLVGGDSLSGSHHLRQNFIWRPFPVWSRYEMPLSHLYMVGAATWPGAGTNATSGYLCAQQLLHPNAARNRLLRKAAVPFAVASATTAAAFLLARLLENDKS